MEVPASRGCVVILPPIGGATQRARARVGGTRRRAAAMARRSPPAGGAAATLACALLLHAAGLASAQAVVEQAGLRIVQPASEKGQLNASLSDFGRPQ